MAIDVQEQVQFVVRLMLGLIFFVSASAKLRAPSSFVRSVQEYRILPVPAARLYGRLLPVVELGAAVLLISGMVLPVAAGLAVLMLVSFAIAVAMVWAQGRELDCHCFGERLADRVGWHTLARDLMLLAPALWLLVSALSSRSDSGWPAGDPIVIVGAIVLATLLALTYGLVVAMLAVVARFAFGHREVH